jgi:hypothetical protein
MPRIVDTCVRERDDDGPVQTLRQEPVERSMKSHEIGRMKIFFVLVSCGFVDRIYFLETVLEEGVDERRNRRTLGQYQ